MDIMDRIDVTERVPGKKGHARRLRKAGRIPGIVYGPGINANTPVSVDPKAFDLQRQRFGRGHLFELTVDGGSQMRVQLKGIDRDPVKRTYTHIDFYAVDMNRPLQIKVPLELHGRAKGIVNGGILAQLQRRVEVSCLPEKVPEKLTLDVTALDINDILHLSDIPFPAGVEATASEDEAVVRIAPPAAKVSVGDGGEGDAAETDSGN